MSRSDSSTDRTQAHVNEATASSLETVAVYRACARETTAMLSHPSALVKKKNYLFFQHLKKPIKTCISVFRSGVSCNLFYRDITDFYGSLFSLGTYMIATPSLVLSCEDSFSILCSSRDSLSHDPSPDTDNHRLTLTANFAVINSPILGKSTEFRNGTINMTCGIFEKNRLSSYNSRKGGRRLARKTQPRRRKHVLKSCAHAREEVRN